MKFITKDNERLEGRPAGEEKPACVILTLLDQNGREFSYTHKLDKVRYNDKELDTLLEGISLAMRSWIGKKLIATDGG